MNYFTTLLVFLAAMAVADAGQVLLKFRNDSDDYLSAHWINPATSATLLIKGDVQPRKAFTLNTYLGHEFEMRQERNPATGLCGSGAEEECDKVSHFVVTEPVEQSFVIREGVQIVTETPPVASQSSREKELIQKNRLK